jgi:hypothetical protein
VKSKRRSLLVAIISILDRSLRHFAKQRECLMAAMQLQIGRFLTRSLTLPRGASWISIHNGGGVGIGYSQHSGMVVVADGTDSSKRRLGRVLTSDPGLGVLRHAGCRVFARD